MTLKLYNNGQTLYDGGEITIRFPKAAYNKQLRRVGVVKEKELTITHMVNLMVNIISDFKSGALCIDDLSEIFERLYAVFEENGISVFCSSVETLV